MDDGFTTNANDEALKEVAKPERIILFGSGARGGSKEGGDLDLLVIEHGAHRRRLAQEIYVNLIGVERSVDVVVVTPEDIERFGDSPALIIEPALRGSPAKSGVRRLRRKCPAQPSA